MWINFNTSKPGAPSKVGGTFVSGGWGTISQFWAADMDGNGRPDLIGFDGSTVWVWRLTGASSAPPTVAQALAVTGFSGYTKILPPADVDGDGKADIAGVTSGGEMRYRRNLSASGSLSFSGSATLMSAGWGTIQHFFVADFDGDGRTDITGRDNDVYYVWLLTGASGAVPTVTARNFGGGYGVYARFAPLVDYDRNGKPDIAGLTSNGELWVGLNVSTPGNPATGGAGSGFVSAGWTSVDTILAADFDGDGVNDLVGRETGGTMLVWQGTGRPSVVQFGPFHYNATFDSCWRLPNATMLLGGKSVELVLDDATGKWKAADDAAAKIEQITDANGERWKATTPDGTQYFFGLNKLPGWQAGDRETGSRLHIPVFANHTTEPCFQSGGFETSWCKLPYRWNLDYVVDVHGNSMSYWYGKEIANTGLFNNPGATASYDRSSYLYQVEYGTRAGTGATRESRPDATPQAKVVFTHAERCFASCWTGTAWQSAPNAANWPDSPLDRDCQTTYCSGNIAPSFWTMRRLAAVTTQVRDAATSSYKDVDRWDLVHTFLATGDQTSPAIWLESVTHTGKAGSGPAITDPPVQFVGQKFENRAHYDAGTVEPIHKYRITNLYNGTGGLAQIYYDGVDCPAGSGGTPDPDQNTQRCYPQWEGDKFTWWAKYRVSKVVESDLVGGGPQITRSYYYSTLGSSTNVLWAFDNSSRFTTATHKRSWSHWSGYSTVTTEVGPNTGPMSSTTNLYMRGMAGDRTDAGDNTRAATITTSDGVALNDDGYLAGFLRETRVWDGGNAVTVTKTVNDPWWQQTSSRNMTAAWSIPAITLGGYQRTGASTTKTWVAASSSWRTTKTITSYDTVYGMPTQIDDQADISTTADDRCTRTTYTRNTTLWLVGMASRAETVGVACGQTPAYPADLLSDLRSFYDGSTTFGTAPTRGLVTKVEQAESHNGTTPTYIAAAESTFDQWGRPLTVKDPLGRQTTNVYTHDTAGRLTRVEATNAASHKVTVNLDPVRGLPLTVVDENNKTTTGQYDTNGRVTKVWRPGHPTSGTPDAEYAYSLSASTPSFVESKVLGPNGNQISSFEIVDGFLRPRQTQTITEAGKRMIADTQYDDRGLPVKQSTFYNSASAPSSTLVTFNDVDIESQTRLVYDSAERQTYAQLWKSNVKQHETRTVYDGDWVGVIPPAGGTVIQDLFDGRGRVIEKRQYQSATSFTGSFNKTLYTYDDADQLVTVKDPASNTWTYEYNLLGQKTKTIDPDSGTSTFTNDNAGQVLSTTDGRGQKLFYEYDNLGRKTKVRADSVSGTVLADWTFDTIQKGQLSSMRRYDGATTYTFAIGSYDDGYRPLSTTDTIPGFGSSGGTLTYTASNTYKPNGALASRSVPAVGGLPAEILTYTYSDTGYTQGMSSAQATYVADTVYLYDGLVAVQILGSAGKQVMVTNTFDHARRLTTLAASVETSPGVFASRFDDTYAYDAVGNIVSIAGKTNGAADQQECFRYDYLQRLTEAWTQVSGACLTPQRTGADPYWRKWTFDAIGNRLSQVDRDATDTTWTYQVGASGGVKPHQLKKIDATGPKAGTALRTFGYDAAGNTTSRTTDTGAAQTLTWDKEGHLGSVTEGSATTSYIYDPNGRRLIAKNSSKSTLYLPDGTELEKIGTSNPLGQRYYGTAVRDAAGLKWIISNHQGTGTAQIDSVALTVNRRRSMPYGEARGTQPSWLGSRGYVGGTKDDTGLTHLGAREYDPTMGRFVSVDPLMVLEDVQSWHGYAYSGNSPITYSDPSGLCVFDEDTGRCMPRTSRPAPSTPEVPGKYPGDVAVVFTPDGEERGKLCFDGDICGYGFGGSDIYDHNALIAEYGRLKATGRYEDSLIGHLLMMHLACQNTKACGIGWANDIHLAYIQLLDESEPDTWWQRAGEGALMAFGFLAPGALGRYRAGSRGRPCNSFDPDTPVLLADGTTKKIKDIHVGDVVLATDPETGETAAKPVTDLIIGQGQKEMAKITISANSGNADILATTNHPFWVENEHRWIDAGDLQPGMTLHGTTGGNTTVIAVSTYSSVQTVNNLTVAGIHTYYVLAGKTPVLVHNTPPDGCRITSAATSPSLTSKTVWTSSNRTMRVDVENPVPGRQGAAGIHVQFMGRGADPNKYYFNPTNGTWVTETGQVLSPRVASQIPQSAVTKAYNLLGVSPP